MTAKAEADGGQGDAAYRCRVRWPSAHGGDCRGGAYLRSLRKAEYLGLHLKRDDGEVHRLRQLRHWPLRLSDSSGLGCRKDGSGSMLRFFMLESNKEA